MEIFKEKEESEVVQKQLDPEGGLTIEPLQVDFDKFVHDMRESTKARVYKEAHQKRTKSDLEEVESNFKHSQEDIQDFITLNDVSDDFAERLISVEDMIEYLDNNEEEINV